jgi:large subunit ribosomal protein L21
MYAVIETGGKQYRVEVGTELEVELLEADAGESITLERVLLVADGSEAAVGTPLVPNAAVEAEVIGRDRGEKVIAFKYRPKARRRVKKGHRQDLTLLRIADIRYNGRSAAEGTTKAPSKAADRKRLEEAAARQAAEDAALAARLSLGTADDATSSEAATKPPKRSRTRPAGEEAATPDAAQGSAAAAAEDQAATSEPAAKPAATARRRSRTKADDAPLADADADADAGAGTPAAADDTPKAAPKRSRTKKDE